MNKVDKQDVCSRLQQEIADERQELEVIRQSIAECHRLENAPEEQQADEGIDTTDNDIEEEDIECEWRTRYDSQVELNDERHKDLQALKERMHMEKKKLKTLQQGGELEEFQGANAKRTMIKLTREKLSLRSQLQDYEWRLDREAELHQKADDKLKSILKDTSRSQSRPQSHVAGKGGQGRHGPHRDKTKQHADSGSKLAMQATGLRAKARAGSKKHALTGLLTRVSEHQ